MKRSVLCAGIVMAATGWALTGCGASDGAAPGAPAEVSSPAAATPIESSPAGQAATEDRTPITCADIAPIVASITGAFEFSAADSVEEPSGATCVWVNDAMREQSSDIADYASLSVGIDSLSWTADELATAPGATDDPRASALGGRLLILGDGATLGEVGSVQLLWPRGSVTIVATGMLLTASPDTAIPVDAVVDVAAQVAALRP